MPSLTPLSFCPVLRLSQYADQEHQRANQESQRADQEYERAERLLAQLRAMGIQPA